MMKILFALLAINAMVFVDGAGCKSCFQRRQEWLAKRPTLEEAFPQLCLEIDAVDQVFDQHLEGGLKNILTHIHRNYLQRIKDARYQTILSSPKQIIHSRSYSSALDFFRGDFKDFFETIKKRNGALFVLFQDNPSHFLAPLLEFLSTFHLNTQELEALAMLDEIENSPIDMEFYFKKYLLCHRMIRLRNATTAQEKLKMMILELEMTKQMPVYSLIPKLTKYVQYEKVLHIIAQETYNLPGEVEKRVVQIQKGYMKERVSCIRNKG